MFNMQETKIAMLPKVSLILVGWSILMLAGGCLHQWGNLDADTTLIMWGGLTILGIVFQLVSMVRGLGLNLTAWLVAIGAGWAFTFYLFKLDNGSHADLFSDLPGVWLILLAVGYVATGFQVDKRFFIIAAVHLLGGVMLELIMHQIFTVQFVSDYLFLVFGLVSGVPLLVAALPFWYGSKKAMAAAQQMTSQA